MNRASILAFGITTAVLAAATWNDSSLTADDEAATPQRTLVAGDLSITAEKREIDVDGQKETHLFLIASGRGSGSVSLRMEGLSGNPMSRVATMSSILWEKTVPFELAGGTSEVDLGALRAKRSDEVPDAIESAFSNGSKQLMATTDGSSYVMIWGEMPSLDALLKGTEGVNPSLQAKADE